MFKKLEINFINNNQLNINKKEINKLISFEIVVELDH